MKNPNSNAEVFDGPFSCSYCSFRFPTRAKLEEHFKKHTAGNIHKCQGCCRLFGKGTSFIRHVRRDCKVNKYLMRRTLFPCEYCEKTCTTVTELLKHMTDHLRSNELQLPDHLKNIVLADVNLNS